MSGVALLAAFVGGLLLGLVLALLAARFAARREQRLLERTGADLQHSFASAAHTALRENSELFLHLARESFSREQLGMDSALREREASIAQLVEPIRATLAATSEQLGAIERERRESFAGLRTQLEMLAASHTSLQRETHNLVSALRRPEVRGRWGELTLRRVVELAGLSEHSDFSEQASVAGAGGVQRPDLVVHMPEQRDLVVDAKTPLDAYLEAIDAGSEEQRRLALARHAQQVEARVRELGSKAYWNQFERSPDFAVLFLPGDQFLGAALAERPQLLEDALRQNVIVATPSTLIALLKAVAYGWRQLRVAENAAQIRDLGQQLHQRLGSFVGHLVRLGQQLGKSVESYNSAVGSLERQVLPGARRFTELGAATGEGIAALEPLDKLARRPAGAGDAGNGATDDSRD